MTAFKSQWADWQPQKSIRRSLVPEGVPEAWVQGVADLLAMAPHPDWPEDDWKTLQADAEAFLRAWGAQATRI